MRYLLDTCVLSEFSKPRPKATVINWVEQRGEERLFICVVTLAEIKKGAARLGQSARAAQIESWLNNEIVERFEGRTIEISSEIALLWGDIQGRTQRAGNPVPIDDSLIAACAITHGLTLVTRNTSDMEATGVTLFDPWTELK